jgi:hypothetical protein
LTTQVDVFSDSDVAPLVLDASDLRGDTGAVVDGSNIKLTAAVNLVKGATLPVGITIGGLVRAGHYTGSLVLRPQQPGNGATVNLDIKLYGKPSLTLATNTITSLTCKFEWTCKLGGQWLGVRQSIAADNTQGAGPAEITGVLVVLHATRGDTALNQKDLQLAPPSSIAVGSGSDIRFKVPTNLPADRYQGSMRLLMNHMDDAVTTPVTLDVRHGPWIAALALLAGILLGRFVQSVNTPQALAQQRLFGTLFTLQGAERDVADPAAQILLTSMIEQARQDIAAMVKTAGDLTTQVADISTAIDLEKSLERLETQAKSLDPASQADVQTHLDAARSAFLKQDFAGAEKERQNAQGLVLEGLSTKPAAAPVRAIMSRLAFATRQPTRERPMGLRVTQAIAGSEKTGPEVKFAIAKPVLFVLLLIGLLVLGMYTLYIKNTTFGADILYDYFSLLAWGLSADVAQRTLQNLPLAK